VAAAEAIAKNGLTVVERQQRLTTMPAAYTSLRQAVTTEDSYDLLLLATKAYDAEPALNELAAFYPSVPLIVTLQNGIGTEELFGREFGAERIVAGSLTTPVSHETYQSIIVERHDRGLGLAATQPKQKIGPWVDLFQGAGIATEAFKHYREMKWSKALLNMIGNASSAILNRHPKAIYGYEPTYLMEMDMLKETLAVMRKMRLEPLDLPGTPTNRLIFAVRRLPPAIVRPILTSIVGGGRGNKTPSFHLDLMAGKQQNEVSYHNGAVARAGEELGVRTPVNAALNDILLKLVRKEIDYQIFNGRPNRLVAEVDKYRKAMRR
jgi:2-dehydropantoate 2-reductase